MSVGSTPSSGSILAPDCATSSRLVRANEASANGKSTLDGAPGPGGGVPPTGGRLEGGGAGVMTALGADSDGTGGVIAGATTLPTGATSCVLPEGTLWLSFDSLLLQAREKASATTLA